MLNPLQPLVVHDIEGLGPGPSIDYELNLQYAGTGFDWSGVRARRVVIWPRKTAEGFRAAAAMADLARAARASSVAVAAPPSRLPSGWRLGDTLPKGIGPRAVYEAVAAAEGRTSRASLPDLALARVATEPVPPFPTEALFGAAVAKAIRMLAAAKGCPEDYVAGLLLPAVLGAAGCWLTIKVRPGWTEDGVLWLMAVGGPSTNKSPAVRVIAEPIERIHRIERDHAEMERALGDKGARAAIVALNDATVPSAMRTLASQDRGLLMLTEEGGSFLANVAASWKGATSSDRSAANDSFSAASRYWFRASVSKEPLYIANGGMCVAAGVQPDVLSEYDMAGARFSDGFAERFLWVCPPPADRAAPQPSEDGLAWAQGLINRIIDRAFAAGKACARIECAFTEQAADGFIRWRDSFYASDAEATGAVTAAGGKAPAHAARVAGAAHLIRWAAGEDSDRPGPVIDDALVRAACEARSGYFEQHRVQMLRAANSCEAERLGSVLARYIAREHVRDITPVELRTKARLPGIHDDVAVLTALRELQMRSWLEPGTLIPSARDWKADMPAKVRVHPRLHEMLAAG